MNKQRVPNKLLDQGIIEVSRYICNIGDEDFVFNVLFSKMDLYKNKCVLRTSYIDKRCLSRVDILVFDNNIQYTNYLIRNKHRKEYMELLLNLNN